MLCNKEAPSLSDVHQRAPIQPPRLQAGLGAVQRAGFQGVVVAVAEQLCPHLAVILLLGSAGSLSHVFLETLVEDQGAIRTGDPDSE